MRKRSKIKTEKSHHFHSRVRDLYKRDESSDNGIPKMKVKIILCVVLKDTLNRIRLCKMKSFVLITLFLLIH